MLTSAAGTTGLAWQGDCTHCRMLERRCCADFITLRAHSKSQAMCGPESWAGGGAFGAPGVGSRRTPRRVLATPGVPAGAAPRARSAHRAQRDAVPHWHQAERHARVMQQKGVELTQRLCVLVSHLWVCHLAIPAAEWGVGVGVFVSFVFGLFFWGVGGGGWGWGALRIGDLGRDACLPGRACQLMQSSVPPVPRLHAPTRRACNHAGRSQGARPQEPPTTGHCPPQSRRPAAPAGAVAHSRLCSPAGWSGAAVLSAPQRHSSARSRPHAPPCPAARSAGQGDCGELLPAPLRPPPDAGRGCSVPRRCSLPRASSPHNLSQNLALPSHTFLSASMKAKSYEACWEGSASSVSSVSLAAPSRSSICQGGGGGRAAKQAGSMPGLACSPRRGCSGFGGADRRRPDARYPGPPLAAASGACERCMLQAT